LKSFFEEFFPLSLFSFLISFPTSEQEKRLFFSPHKKKKKNHIFVFSDLGRDPRARVNKKERAKKKRARARGFIVLRGERSTN